MASGFQPPTGAEVHTAESLRGFNELADHVVVVDCSGFEDCCGAGKVAQCVWANTAARSFIEERSLCAVGDTDISQLLPSALSFELYRKVQQLGKLMSKRRSFESTTAPLDGDGEGRLLDPVTFDSSFRPILFRDGDEEEARQLILMDLVKESILLCDPGTGSVLYANLAARQQAPRRQRYPLRAGDDQEESDDAAGSATHDAAEQDLTSILET
ncbi:hypothetical protein T484DRAFT_1840982, partial [Baffinella frigidus]